MTKFPLRGVGQFVFRGDHYSNFLPADRILMQKAKTAGSCTWATPLTSVRLHGLLISAKTGPASVVFWEHGHMHQYKKKKALIW